MIFDFRWAFLMALAGLAMACSPQPTLEVPKEFKEGQKIFHSVCSNCHGPDAMGGNTKAPRLIDTDFIESEFSDEDFRETIINGTGKMPPQKNKIDDGEIAEVIKYLRYSQKAADLTPEDQIEEEDIEDDSESEDS